MSQPLFVTNVVKGGYWLSSTAGQLLPANIDATYYSHLFCGYAEIDLTTYNVTIPSTEDTLINNFSSNVRMSKPEVKTLLSIKGDKDVFSKMASDPATRAVFIQSSIDAAVKGTFNGLDLRWLYPSSQDDMHNFEIFVLEWRQAATIDFKTYHRPNPWILVASVSNLPYIQHNVEYPAEAIKQNLDWINIISYDFYTPTSSPSFTGPSSALHNYKANSLSANFGMDSWIQSFRNIPPNKIVFGIPFHGWAWKLANASEHDVFSKADGPAASAGGYLISPEGQIDYTSVKMFINETKAKVNVPNDPGFVIAYTSAETTWIAYESEKTIPVKIATAKEKNVLGYFCWNIAGDDEAYTLANAANTNW